MARRSILVTMAVAVAAAWSGNAFAATAPSAPQLTSTPWVSPAVFTWTPGADLLNVSQTVYRAPGACTTPLATGVPVRVYPDNTTSQHFAVPGDGTFCFYVSAADALGGTAPGPGLTIGIDTTPPSSTVSVSGMAVGGVVKGTVSVSHTAADATSGVATNVLRIGAVGACATGALLALSWDTTTYADGSYDVCNIVTDRAGLVATATLRVTVANTVPVPVPAPVPSPIVQTAVTPAAPAGVVLPAADAGAAGDKVAPHAPTKLAVVQSRSRSGSGLIPLTLHWANPAAADLDRVVVVLNGKRPPRSARDGSIVYHGLRTSTIIKLRAGKSGHLALFAVDRSGNISPPARKTVSLASLIPLRPLTGSVVTSAPLLTWTPTEGTAYYNVQVFRDGKRVLTAWPAHASYRFPASLLAPGTYTWFVWPALKGKGSAASFGALIGRATFVSDR